MKIRKATNKDSPEIANLIFNIWRKEYNFTIRPEDYPDLVDIEGKYSAKGGLFLVAEIDYCIVGTIACVPFDANTCVLKRMFVHKELRKRGIAQALLDRLFVEIKTGKAEEKVTLLLSTNRKLAINAQKFYRKNDFREVSLEHLPKNFPFFLDDDLFLIKSL